MQNVNYVISTSVFFVKTERNIREIIMSREMCMACANIQHFTTAEINFLLDIKKGYDCTRHKIK